MRTSGTVAAGEGGGEEQQQQQKQKDEEEQTEEEVEQKEEELQQLQTTPTLINSYPVPHGILEIGPELLFTPFGKPPLIRCCARE